jgi:hypothetical protein
MSGKLWSLPLLAQINGIASSRKVGMMSIWVTTSISPDWGPFCDAFPASISVPGRSSKGAPSNGCIASVERRNPEVEHAVDRSTEGNPGAVRTDPHDASLGIPENHASGK